MREECGVHATYAGSSPTAQATNAAGVCKNAQTVPRAVASTRENPERRTMDCMSVTAATFQVLTSPLKFEAPSNCDAARERSDDA